MSPETKQAVTLAAGWVAISVVATVGLSSREALIVSVTAAVIFVAVHFVLLWARDGSLEDDDEPIALQTPASITERREESDRGRLTERRLSHLAELADVGLVQASRDGEIEFASRRARELLDISEHLEPSDAWHRSFDEIKASFSPNTTSTGAVQIVTTSGPTVLSLKAHPVEEDDWSGYLVQVRDRRLLDALESDLRSASRLRVLNHLYLGVAHDLKGPLNAIMLTIEGLRADMEDGTGEPARQIERIDIIQDELGRHHRSLETLLIQTAPERLERQSFDLGEVVEQVGRLIRPQLKHQKIELEVETSGPAMVNAIQDRIREAVLALAVNAMEAMPRGGKLGLALNRQGSFCTLEISDTGEGIPDEFRDRIFDLRFTTKKTGTGIGLSTARSVVESEGGNIDIAVTGENGSTFRILLPADQTK